MQNPMKRLAFSIITLCVFSCFASARPIEITGVAATVNGKVVTKKEVRSLMAPTVSLLRTKYPRGGEAMEMEFQKAQNDVLEQLIENKIILSELEERGAALPDYVIDQEVNRITTEIFNGSEAEFRKNLQESGTTMRAFRETQKEKILVQALKGQQFSRDVVPPTPEELKAQYNKRKLEYRDRTKDKITFQKIFISAAGDTPESTPETQLELAEQVANNLRNGADFALTAKKYSDDAYAEDGGLWPESARTDFDPSFAELLFQADLNSVEGPYKDPRGFTIVEVVAKKYGPSPPLSKIKDQIEREIKAEKYDERYQRWIKTLKRNAIIDRRM